MAVAGTCQGWVSATVLDLFVTEGVLVSYTQMRAVINISDSVAAIPLLLLFSRKQKGE